MKADTMYCLLPLFHFVFRLGKLCHMNKEDPQFGRLYQDLTICETYFSV